MANWTDWGVCSVFCSPGGNQTRSCLEGKICLESGEGWTWQTCGYACSGVDTPFGVAAIIMLIPPTFVALAAFWSRRGVQPIKARSPTLVIFLGLAFVIWILLLCFQRIYSQTYPCLLSVWQAYLGVIFLCNIYMTRCLLLFVNFNLTSLMMAVNEENKANELKKIESAKQKAAKAAEKHAAKKAKRGEQEGKQDDDEDTVGDGPKPVMRSDSDSEEEPPEEDEESTTRSHSRGGSIAPLKNDTADSIAKFKRYLSVRYLVAGNGIVAFIGLLPPFVVSVDPALYADTVRHVGDGCWIRQKGTALVLALGVVLYLIGFLGFAYKLRGLSDAFYIKDELRMVALGELPFIVAWYIFNNSSFLNTNITVFPFSTLALVLGAVYALFISVGYPLYRTVYMPPMVQIQTAVRVETLEELLAVPAGYESFKAFLQTEFSVENVLFWKAARDLSVAARSSQTLEYHEQVAKTMELAMQAEAVVTQYVVSSAPLEVNLPATNVKEITQGVKEIKGGLGKLMRTGKKNEKAGENATDMLSRIAELFNASEAEIFKLMKRDSEPRYRRSEHYARLAGEINKGAEEHDRMVKLGVL